MSGPSIAFPFLPSTAFVLPSQDFDTLIATDGQRVSWLKSHTCPCVFAGGSANGRLPQLGSAQRNCTRCFGVGTYWDPPTIPIRMYIEYAHMAPTPDEPGVSFNEAYGTWQSSEPTLTIPFMNPNFPVGDPNQPTNVWTNASTDDKFVPVDMQARYTAVLQVGIKENLPYQQNLSVAPQNAVTVWDPISGNVQVIANYSVVGATVQDRQRLSDRHKLHGGVLGGAYLRRLQNRRRSAAYSSFGWRQCPAAAAVPGFQALDFWTRQRRIEETRLLAV